MMTLAQAHALLPASRIVGDPAVEFERVHTDTRTLRPGDLYVALRGERFDGHDFLAQARAAGAVAAMAEHGLGNEVDQGGQGAQGDQDDQTPAVERATGDETARDAGAMPGLLVDDTLLALQTLAATWRARLHLALVAVTGSNGKTTVTQMVASILRAWLGDASLATAGNLNNHIGVPLTLLRLRQDDTAWHRAAVVELGMNHAGEIALLARIAQPTVVLVNNAQREHQEFMPGVEAVARENGSAIDVLGAAGVAVFPADDAHTPLWRAMAGPRRVITFAAAADRGGDAAADVTALPAWNASAAMWTLRLFTPSGAASTVLAMPGRHNVANALAATACALGAGAPLEAVVQGLAAFRPVAGRSQALPLRVHGRGLTLVDDSYNANPDSVLAAIDLLAAMPAPRWLILGDMGEVGAQGPQFHAEVGAHARSRGIESVWSAGALCTHLGVGRHFAGVEALADAAAEALRDAAHDPPAASVLVKGSRFMKMERVVAALRSAADAGEPHAA